MTRSGNRTMAVVAALLGVLMIGSGTMKLAGETSQVTSFAAFGLAPWFRVLVGTFEVIGGILMAVPATTPIGSLILSTIVVGALWAHAAHMEFSRMIPAGIMLTLFLWVFRRNRSRAIELLGGVRESAGAHVPRHAHDVLGTDFTSLERAAGRTKA